MPTTTTENCRACRGQLTETSIFTGLCQPCVATIGTRAIDDLERVPGAICGDTINLDRGMLGHAGIQFTTADDGFDPDSLAAEDQHRLDLLWALGSRVDELSRLLLGLRSALGDAGRPVDGRVAIPLGYLIDALQKTSRDLTTARNELTDLQETYDCLQETYDCTREAYRRNSADLCRTQARAERLAAIARKGLRFQHKRHRGPMDQCPICGAEWAVATGDGEN